MEAEWGKYKKDFGDDGKGEKIPEPLEIWKVGRLSFACRWIGEEDSAVFYMGRD